MNLIEIKWEGPFTLEQVSALNSDIDYGVYQIYGTHNIIGTDSLLYIGLASAQTFSARLPQREWIHNEFHEFKIYIGRIGAAIGCTKDKWDQLISHTELILIDHCQPPYNSQGLNGLPNDIGNDILILNFGKRHKLPYSLTTAWQQSSFYKKNWKPYSNTMY